MGGLSTIAHLEAEMGQRQAEYTWSKTFNSNKELLKTTAQDNLYYVI